jgi:hypothetical protein
MVAARRDVGRDGVGGSRLPIGVVAPTDDVARTRLNCTAVVAARRDVGRGP